MEMSRMMCKRLIKTLPRETCPKWARCFKEMMPTPVKDEIKGEKREPAFLEGASPRRRRMSTKGVGEGPSVKSEAASVPIARVGNAASEACDKYFVGWDAEAKQAWRVLATDEDGCKDFAKHTFFRDDDADDDVAYAQWADGFLHSISALTKAQAKSMQEVSQELGQKRRKQPLWKGDKFFVKEKKDQYNKPLLIV